MTKMKKTITKNSKAYRILPGQAPTLVNAREEEVWAVQHPSLSPVYRCAGSGASGKCRAHMMLVHRSKVVYQPYFRTVGSTHLIDCPFNSGCSIKNVSQLSKEVEKLDLSAGLTKLPDFGWQPIPRNQKRDAMPEEEEKHFEDEGDEIFEIRNVFRKARSPYEYYYLLKEAASTDKIFDGRVKEEVLVDADSFEKYRNGSRELQGSGIVVATGGVTPEISSHFKNPKAPAIVMKDPFRSVSQTKAIHYVLRFEKWEHFNSIYKMKNFSLKMGKIYIILADWHRVRCEALPGMVIYEAIMSSEKQLAIITLGKILEDSKSLRSECRKVYEMETQ